MDLRLQDGLILAAVVFTIVTARPSQVSMRLVWGWMLMAFYVTSLLVLIWHLLVAGTLDLRMIGAYGRALEAFLLAIIACQLYAIGGKGSQRAVLKSFHLVAGLNLTWFAYQFLSGTSATLFRDIEGVTSYGPRLIGEPSAFSAGFFFVVVVALAAAEYRTRVVSRWFAVTLGAGGVLGVFLTESRISMVAVGLIAIATFIRPSVSQRPMLTRLLAGAGVAALLAWVLVPLASSQEAYVQTLDVFDRVSLDRLSDAADLRANEIWRPMLNVVLQKPLVGIGPGGPDRELYEWPEAHNAIIRAWLDYGLLAGTLFLAIFIKAALTARRVSRNSVSGDATMANFSLLTILGLFVSGIVHDSFTVVMSSHLTLIAVGLLGGSMAVTRGELRSRAPDPRRSPHGIRPWGQQDPPMATPRRPVQASGHAPPAGSSVRRL